MPGETLRVVLGAAAGTEIPLDDTFTLGRTESGHGSLGGDPELSRQHARITRTPDGGLEITDLNSTNGTHVNGVRIAGPQRLNAGDTIRVGQTTITVPIAPTADADRTVIGATPQGAPLGLGAPPFPPEPTPPPAGFEQASPPPPFVPPAPAGQASWEKSAPPVEEPPRPPWEPARPVEEPERASWEPAPAAGEVPLPPSPQPPSPGPGPGPPSPAPPDPLPPSPGPEPGPPGPPAPDPAPPAPGPEPGPPGPLPGPGPQISHQPGPFGDPPIQKPPAEEASPHGDPLGAPAGMAAGDPLGGPREVPFGDPPGGGSSTELPPSAELRDDPFGGPPPGGPGPALPDSPEGTAGLGSPALGGEATRFDAGRTPDPASPPLPAAASVPQPAAPPPFAAPPAPPIEEHGTQRYAAATPAYAQAPSPGPGAIGPSGAAYELKRPIGRQVILYVMSFGLWGFYWFYDTRKKLNGEMGKPDDAGVKTACLLIPIYNIFLIYQLWDDLNTVRTHNYRLPELNVPVLLVVSIIVPFGVFWAYPKVANALNEYWDHRTQGQATEAPVTGTEKLLACVGLGLLALYLIFLILIIAVAASG